MEDDVQTDPAEPAVPDAATGRSAVSGKSRHRLAAAILAGTLVTCCLAVFAWPRPAFRAVDITGAAWGRDFRLHDQDGRLRTLADFHGDVVLLFFGFTQCPDVCPTTLARAADVVARLGPDGKRVQVIFVTLDPERDTPAILKAYTESFDPRFLALRDEPEAIAATARAFHIFFRRVPTGSSYTLDHTAVTYVFDPGGRLRLAVGHDESAAALAADVRQLVRSGS